MDDIRVVIMVTTVIVVGIWLVLVILIPGPGPETGYRGRRFRASLPDLVVAATMVISITALTMVIVMLGVMSKPLTMTCTMDPSPSGGSGTVVQRCLVSW